MIKIGSIYFSQEISDQVAQCYTNLPQPPKEVTIKETYVFNEEGKDIKAFSIFEYQDADESIAAKYLEKRYQAFSNIAGLTYNIENWLRVDDALEIIGNGNFNFESDFSLKNL